MKKRTATIIAVLAVLAAVAVLVAYRGKSDVSEPDTRKPLSDETGAGLTDAEISVISSWNGPMPYNSDMTPVDNGYIGGTKVLYSPLQSGRFEYPTYRR